MNYLDNIDYLEFDRINRQNIADHLDDEYPDCNVFVKNDDELLEVDPEKLREVIGA